MEVVTGFFVEAGFIGVLLYGDWRVRERTMFLCICVVALGTVLSTTWIMAANSWMQTPAGFSIVNGQFRTGSWFKVIINPSVLWRFPHMLVAVLISAAWMIGGISAYYLVRLRNQEFARRTFSLALGVLAVLLPLQLELGDHVYGEVLIKYQLPKAAAVEGNWTSTNTGYNVFAIPDESQQRDRVLITVPRAFSYIAKDLSGKTAAPGMLLIPGSEDSCTARDGSTGWCCG